MLPRVLLIALIAAGCGDKKTDTEPESTPPPAAAAWKRVELGDTIKGTVESPPEAAVEVGKITDDSGVHIADARIKLGDADVLFTPGNPAEPATLDAYKQLLKIAPDAVIRESSVADGFTIAFKTGGNVIVHSRFPFVSCGAAMSSEASVDAAYQVCSSFRGK